MLAGGCFWGVQGVFQHVGGVTSAVSGYAGGDKDTAHYETVGTGVTGHAESVRVTFDPRRISYGRILQIYFSVARDPTELNYQGTDRLGTNTAQRSFQALRSRRTLQAPMWPSSIRWTLSGPRSSQRSRPAGVLSGGGVSSGLPDAAAGQLIYRLQ